MQKVSGSIAPDSQGMSASSSSRQPPSYHGCAGYSAEAAGRLGGQIVAYVHVTCQRFRPDSAEHLRQIVSKMIGELSTVRAFPLMAGSIVTLHSEFWQSTLARWTVQENAAWQSFISKINGLLLDMSCPPHYPGDKPPTCSALEHIPSQQASTVELSECIAPSAVRSPPGHFLTRGGRGEFHFVRKYSVRIRFVYRW